LTAATIEHRIALVSRPVQRIWLFLRQAGIPPDETGNGKSAILLRVAGSTVAIGARAISDQDMPGIWVDTDIVGVVAQIDAACSA